MFSYNYPRHMMSSSSPFGYGGYGYAPQRAPSSSYYFDDPYEFELERRKRAEAEREARMRQAYAARARQRNPYFSAYPDELNDDEYEREMFLRQRQYQQEREREAYQREMRRRQLEQEYIRQRMMRASSPQEQRDYPMTVSAQQPTGSTATPPPPSASAPLSSATDAQPLGMAGTTNDPGREAAATKIQETWRRYSSSNKIRAIHTSFSTLRNEFERDFPTTLDFLVPSSAEIVSLPSTSSHMTFPVKSVGSSSKVKLAYTKTNRPIHAYVEGLARLLVQLDAVESYGDAQVRKRRKEVVNEIEREAESVEKRWRAVWDAAVSAKAEQQEKSEQEKSSQEPVLAPASAPELEPEAMEVQSSDTPASTAPVGASEDVPMDADDTTEHDDDDEDRDDFVEVQEMLVDPSSTNDDYSQQPSKESFATSAEEPIIEEPDEEDKASPSSSSSYEDAWDWEPVTMEDEDSSYDVPSTTTTSSVPVMPPA